MSKKDVAIQPLGKRIVVMPEKVEERTSAGLIIPPTAMDDKKPEVGVVVKLGSGAKNFTFTVKTGDRVFFKKYSPDEIVVDGETYYILAEEDVLAVIS